MKYDFLKGTKNIYALIYETMTDIIPNSSTKLHFPRENKFCDKLNQSYYIALIFWQTHNILINVNINPS